MDTAGTIVRHALKLHTLRGVCHYTLIANNPFVPGSLQEYRCLCRKTVFMPQANV